MNLNAAHHHHRRPAVSPDWRRLVLGVLMVVLMGLQGAAALAHGHSHGDPAAPVIASAVTGSGFEAPRPDRPVPASTCPVCQSPLGMAPLLPPVSAMAVPAVMPQTLLAPPDVRAPRPLRSDVRRARGPPRQL